MNRDLLATIRGTFTAVLNGLGTCPGPAGESQVLSQGYNETLLWKQRLSNLILITYICVICLLKLPLGEG